MLKQNIVVVFEVFMHLIKESGAHRDSFGQMLVSSERVFLFWFPTIELKQLKVRLRIAHFGGLGEHFNGFIEVTADAKAFLIKHANPMHSDEASQFRALVVELCRLFFVALLLVLSVCKLSQSVKSASTGAFFGQESKRRFNLL